MRMEKVEYGNSTPAEAGEKMTADLSAAFLAEYKVNINTVTGLRHCNELIPEKLLRYLEDVQSQGGVLVIAVGDINDFKNVNDTHGYHDADASLEGYFNRKKRVY